MSINRAVLEGYLGDTPKITTMQSGGRVMNFRMATSKSWLDKISGERKERSQWHNVVCFAHWIVDEMDGRLRKGSRVLVEGQLETRSYEKDGQERYTTGVVVRSGGHQLLLIDHVKRDRGAPPPSDDPRKAGSAPPAGGKPPFDDEIPF